MSTAGNSFMVTRKTIAIPIKMLGLSRGRVIFVYVESDDFPKVLDDSSNLGLMCSNDDLTEPRPVGR